MSLHSSSWFPLPIFFFHRLISGFFVYLFSFLQALFPFYRNIISINSPFNSPSGFLWNFLLSLLLFSEISLWHFFNTTWYILCALRSFFCVYLSLIFCIYLSLKLEAIFKEMDREEGLSRRRSEYKTYWSNVRNKVQIPRIYLFAWRAWCDSPLAIPELWGLQCISGESYLTKLA